MKIQNQKFNKPGAKPNKKEDKSAINPVVVGVLLFIVVGSAVLGIFSAAF